MRVLTAFRNVILLMLLSFAGAASAQEDFSKAIPQVNLSFFKGTPPKNSAYASMTFIDYDYQFAIERSTRTNEVKVKLTVNITPNSAKSYFDTTRVNKADLDRLLDHERGHIVLGYIIGRKVEADLNASKYTKNYNQEIRENYKKFYARYEKLQLEYDKETRHGADWTAQESWNEKIRLLAEEV